MKWLDRFAERLFTSPLLWGGAASFIFHILLEKSPIKLPPWLLQRLTGQWESYLCTTMFLIAIAFVVRRSIWLVMQIRTLHWFDLETSNADGLEASLERRLEAFEESWWLKRSLLYRRLQDAHQFCQRTDAASSLPGRLKELSDADSDRLYNQYGLLRMLIWAIPSCGSVATILAIAQVVEKLGADNSGDVLTSAAGGLSGAFGLFAFTVGLAIVLVVLKFAVEQADQIVLATIDRQVSLATASKIEEKTAQPGLPVDQLRQLTELLKSVAGSLTQASQNMSRVQAPAAAGTQPKEIEAAVQTALASVLARQPSLSVGGDATGMDSSGWKALQHVLQKLAHVLELQNAKLETEGRVSKHLTTIIDEGIRETSSPLGMQGGVQTAAVASRF